jgi:tetratricopeptide (TPR) repeat protein
MSMKGMKGLALVLAVVLLGSMIPLGLAESNGTAANGTTGYVGLMDNGTREMVIANNLIEKLQHLSKFAEGRIEPIKDKLPENSSILKNYGLAEEFKDKAITKYQDGDYYNSILDSLTAMHYYRLALTGLKEGKERVQDVKEHIRMAVERLREYFGFVDKTIRIAENQGIDVSNLTRLYNETKGAYETVLEDLKAGNYEKARTDFKAAQEKKALLDEELKKVREELAYANADKIVKEFLERGEKGIEIAQKVIQLGQERGYNTTELQERLDAFTAVYDQVKGLADEGQWEEALSVMQENRGTIEDFHQAIAFVMRKAHERELQEKLRDVRAFLREMTDRIQKDSKALRGLRSRGVNTRRADLQLKVASQELRIGVRLLQERKPEQAKMHFEIALDMLHRVDEFILAHA